jgi:hypothetical protein
MIELIPWTKREFLFDQPFGVFPAILERLRGTPARAAELVADVPEGLLSSRLDGKWCVKEHLGHLADLEPLDEKRLREFQARVPVLSPADMGNQATENGNHRVTPVAKILQRMRLGRAELLERLEQLTAEQVATVSIHPRLQKPLRLLDWAYFVAEHDDHHLACVTRTIRELSGRSGQSHYQEGRRPVAG